jgi:hypothetical protein
MQTPEVSIGKVKIDEIINEDTNDTQGVIQKVGNIKKILNRFERVKMNSKQRIKSALDHKSTDRIPVDFGGTPVTGIHVLPIERLRDYYGLEKRPVKVIEPYQMLGEIDDELKDILGVDTIGLSSKNNMFGISQENWKEFRMPWGQVVLLPGEFNTTTDGDGNLLIYPEGDLEASASAKMPASGYFFDAIIRQEPIDENELRVEDNLEEFKSISGNDLIYWKNQVEKNAGSNRALVANFGGTAFGDIALVPAVQLKNPKGIRDIAEWYISTAIRQDYIHAIFDKQCKIALENLGKLFEIVGNRIDVIFICGTDFGTQTSQFCSGATFNELYAPYYKRINTWVHKNTEWKTMKHSCGAVEPLMKNFIDSGFDIINPVQVSATGMDPLYLKKEYGQHLVFWGGGVDTQKTFPFGTPEEVYREVRERIDIFARDGGFVFNTIHNIQSTVPVKNILAMLKAIKDS